MMDKIFIKGLKVKTHIGIYEWERQLVQTILIDLEMNINAAKVATIDDINTTINYQAVAERLKALIVSKSFQLVETLAEELAQIIKAEFAVSWLRLTVSKPNAFADVDLVGVTIER